MKNEIATLRPTDLRDFLKSQGWSLVPEALDDGLYVMNSPSDSGRQVLFPTDSAAIDYIDALQIALSKIMSVGNYDLDNLTRRIRTAKSDVLTLRVMTKDDRFSLPFESATRLFAGIEKLLRSATASVIHPRIFHPRLRFSETAQLLNQAQMEQTAPGSFVFNVSCDLFALDDARDLLTGSDDGSFVRKVFSNAYNSAQTIVRSIESDRVDDLIQQNKDTDSPLVSANICDALGNILDPDNRTTELNVEWSGLMPKVPTRPIKLRSEFATGLARLASSLKETKSEKPEFYIGTVESLDGEIGEDGRREGNVILALLQSDEGETVRARAFLNADDYLKADKAHMTNGSFIKLSGVLTPGRQPRVLRDVTDFDLL